MPRQKQAPTPAEKVATIQALLDRNPSRWEVVDWLGWNIGGGASGPFTQNKAEVHFHVSSLVEYVCCRCKECNRLKTLPRKQLIAGAVEHRCDHCVPKAKGKRQQYIDRKGRKRWRVVA